MQRFFKNIRSVGWMLIVCMTISGCGGPSEEKIAQAQQTYTELVELHNQVVEAHKGIHETSLDEGLQALAQKLDKVDEFALNEMKDEDIDLLIETMGTIRESYEEYLVKIEEIHAAEDAAVLIPISLTLTNSTEQTFSKIVLYPQNDISQKTDVLQGAFSFEPGQSLMGLTVHKDVNATPWVMELESADGTSCELALPVKDLNEDGEILTLIFDSEKEEIMFQGK